MKEEFRTILGYEGLYEISSFGRVKNVRRNTILALKESHGYLRAGLFRNGIRVFYQTHRLVMAAFKGQLPEGHYVNHKNGIKSDNHIGNLEYVTASQNMRHAQTVLGRKFGKRLDGGQGGSIMTVHDVVIARKLWKLGLRQKLIAKIMGVKVATIHSTVNYRRWKEVA